ncbi:unnamed protein product [Phytophthora lilii]|uniref:Unnamed protein product n=1 Tax=Phytophthora lilii TaxID=2077276 RepID=A0A9W6TA67_9STRA|nr:unnamed protein product [Phytophthora lilii]
MVPLFKSANASDEASYGTHEVAGSTEALRISGSEWGDSLDEIQPTGATTEALDTQPSELDPTEDNPSTAESNSVKTLYSNYVCALVGGEPDTVDADTTATAEHTATVGGLDDYAHELAFLPDLSEVSVTDLNYTGGNVLNQDLSQDEQQRLIDVLKAHETIMISSGNALPPPAYGVVCDIDVGDHPPIKQRARRVPLRHLRKLYELLKGLLTAGLVAFSDSPWASPIVIVLKKNGVGIRLCIDYMMVIDA